mmetsp:Transcript_3185/g.11343  ORF Transcript_3185/g.11343 Transcript_3185/m.11343 type:complete len:101 (-) Transcript_3185:143-445(-)
MVVKEKGGEVSASVAETNRIRALLGLKPLAGTEAAAQPAEAALDSSVGPQLPSGVAELSAPAGQPPRGKAKARKVDEAAGAAAVLALRLDRYTDARPSWK